MRFLIFLLVSIPLVCADLRVGFYNSSNLVQRHFRNGPSITAVLLRVHFHDCFVRGCDASILINPTATQQSKRTVGPNLSVRGFAVINKAKLKLESQLELALENSTAGFVAELRSDDGGFLRKFGDAKVKMGGIEVLVGSEGEIRKMCGAFN